MIFNKVSSTNKVKSLNYYENLNDKYNNPYFEYENNNDFISLKTDNLSVHNFFYYFDSENFILNSEFISLIEDISKLNVKIILDKKTIYTFLTTNTFLGNKTFIKNIYKIMPGEMIYFSKSTKKLEIKKKNILSNIYKLGSYKDNDIQDQIIKIIKKNYNYEDLLLLNSGGFDTRLIFSILLFIKKNFVCGTYHDNKSLDFIISKEICNAFNIELNEYKFNSLFDEMLLNTEAFNQSSDFRLAFHHSHALFANNFNNISKNLISGIWFEFFASGFTNTKRLNLTSKNLINNNILNQFIKGSWSGIDISKFQKKIIPDCKKIDLISIIKEFIKEFEEFDDIYKYDLAHFFSHGTGRYMSVFNMLSKKNNILTPGFNTDIFLLMLYVHPNKRFQRKFQIEFINRINKSLMSFNFVKDNHKLMYLGKNWFKIVINRIEVILRNKKIKLLKPWHDIYVEHMKFDKDKKVFNKIKNIINSSDYLKNDFFHKEYIPTFFHENFLKRNSHSHHGALMTFIDFYKKFEQKLHINND